MVQTKSVSFPSSVVSVRSATRSLVEVLWKLFFNVIVCVFMRLNVVMGLGGVVCELHFFEPVLHGIDDLRLFCVVAVGLAVPDPYAPVAGGVVSDFHQDFAVEEDTF